MNQTKQEAAEAFSKYPNGQPTVGYHLNDIISAEKQAFLAGAEWAELKWIPATERLPDEGQKVFIWSSGVWSDEPGMKMGVYYNRIMWSTDVLAWCAIPDSLLNFKP